MGEEWRDRRRWSSAGGGVEDEGRRERNSDGG